MFRPRKTLAIKAHWLQYVPAGLTFRETPEKQPLINY